MDRKNQDLKHWKIIELKRQEHESRSRLWANVGKLEDVSNATK